MEQLAFVHQSATTVTEDDLNRYLRIINYTTPIALFFFFLFVFTLRSILIASDTTTNAQKSTQLGPGGKPLPTTDPLRNVKKKVQDEVTATQKWMFQVVSVAATCTFIANTVNIVAHTVYDRKEEWWCGKSVVVYVVGTFFVYCLVLISIIDQKPSPNTSHFATWILAVLFEIAILSGSLALYTRDHREPGLKEISERKEQQGMTKWEIAEVVIDLLRILLLLTLIGSYLVFVTWARKKHTQEAGSASETASLLGGGHREAENGHANGGYGSTGAVGNKKPPVQEAQPGWVRPVAAPSRSWVEYIKGYHVFFPYLWPSKDRRLQIVVVLCFLLVILQRIVNVKVPDQFGKIINDLAGENGTDGDGAIRTPWKGIIFFIALRFLQGNNGILGALRSALWIPVSQYSYRELSVASFEHVHSLSLDFHLGKKTGEVLSALGKGSSINTFLEQVTFQVVPMLVDLGVAIGYFMVAFDVYYALVISVVTFWYIYVTIRMAQWRTEIRREMVNADREQDAVKSDSMISYETVKYFNAEAYEFNRYRDAVNKYQKAEYKVSMSLNLMNIAQNMVFMSGLMISCFIAAYQVTSKQVKVGQFTTLVTYMAQLQQPLNFFGTFYRMIQSAMINSERMLELFKERPTVVDKKGAVDLLSCEGDLRFNDVHFSYDNRKPALQGLDFHCAPGTTTAFVGESGGGKSTVFRLLFRFYNTMSGSIQVDGRDVEDLTIDSVRKHIGVVPQDTVLFNETLMYNLKYANPQATDEQVYEACRAASIHDKIMAFPDKYETKVGERGLRLSGGEKQRVAIARTILKNPRIIMLDEATAALDTETEQHIQEAFTTLSKGRTMLVIAHRLSTITHADQILVLNKGRVAERGTHEELLEKNGQYANMWKKQIRAQRAAEQAKVLKDKADRLRRESKDAACLTTDGSSSRSSSSSNSDDEQAQKGRNAEPAAAVDTQKK
ncbi:vacuolar ABC heavy metal transporter-like protein [Delitschia confertaspora ATCC 74209]|uniref:Vacuolar ABC heavy metal transporter-like protein n=1 Tax=Delitschia confertaspora ATCC 74209 TaxID=1513339 RepID=A0A9P4JHK2_9PLEO|nr:vacuolar ABC heavy metal transporter-like protein [Delitschia confertaspora ATCC 74209]